MARDIQLEQPITGDSIAAPSIFQRLNLIRLSLYLVLLAGAFIALLPFYWMLAASLMTYGETAIRRLWPEVPQFMNYAEAWNEANFSKYFLNTIIIVAVSLSGQLATSKYHDDPQHGVDDSQLYDDPRQHLPTARR